MKTRIGLSLAIGALLGARAPASAQSVVAGGAARSVAARPAAPRPATYGGLVESYIQVQPNEFTPFDTGTTYGDLGDGGSFFSRYATGGNGYFYAGLHVPDGALLTSVEFDYCDSNTAGQRAHLYVYECFTDGSGCGLLWQLNSANTGGCSETAVFVSPAGHQVNNILYRLFLSANTEAFDGTNSISGAIIGYQLQVSPAPTVASFVDVPTTSPIFKFVEALRASGITAGCDATHYCPNDPLTRGQMAVFLAAGLGLQFP